MDKRAIGKARTEKLDVVLSDLLDQDDNALRNTLKSDLFKKEGAFHLGNLAQLVGMDCKAANSADQRYVGICFDRGSNGA
jgi:hypothetical protein